MQPQITKNFSANLREAISHRGMTQPEVCEASGISYTYLHQIFRIEANPSIQVCCDLARALDLPLVAMLQDPEEFRNYLENLPISS